MSSSAPPPPPPSAAAAAAATTTTTSSSSAEARFLASSTSRTTALHQKSTLRATALASNSAESEDVSTFLKSFNATLQRCLAALSELPGGVAVTAKSRASVLATLTSLQSSALGLRSETAAASHFLNPYDVRSCEIKATSLLADISAAKTARVPREKFVFKSRRTTGAFVNVAEREEAGDDERQTRDDSDAHEINDRAANYSTEHAGLKAARVTSHRPSKPWDGKDARVKDCEGCTVALLDVYGAVRLQGLRNCTVYLGAVLGPLYVENVENCRVFGRSRQLRIHGTSGTDFYVWTKSGPIIEECKGVRFGEYCLEYDGSEEHGAELGGGKNFYADVQDFKWLKKMKSPNFEVFDIAKDEDAVESSEWEGVVTVGTGRARRKEERTKREAEDKKRREMEEAQEV
eukprot:CAMPEP_0197553778 /NCGR_PEP_ID=MMETSP1320-20131121/9850_1 /TAXON_ID=91990 /ORGANISM="Bolidomonas sp., Strain RCC2347" /LENGTH=403 /DNA_ID=CAMNT_0043114583 /DNA_START=157 /DNA_END=1365 /DNA_ORIENTATION=-